MAGSIENCELFFASVEGSATYFHCLALCLFFFSNVHAVGEPPGITSFVFSVFFILFDHSFVDAAHEVHYLTRDG